MSKEFIFPPKCRHLLVPRQQLHALLGDFRKDIRGLMTKIVRFLDSKKSPFVVNIYPYLSLYQDPNFLVDFAFFDGKSQLVVDDGLHYTNVFDANYDTLVWSLRKADVPNMKIIVGEVGWPTDGAENANTKLAKRFYDGLLKKMAKEVGTPLRPGKMGWIGIRSERPECSICRNDGACWMRRRRRGS